ncbi:oxidoreductase-like domain-containing protein [Massilia glaciei]|uniref:Oxidoreductase n=1 Tax=Massilia glaciei TaxID=1524097 RepID=A0A2U2HPA0_9BURK|nr:oxidoreductase-like domain-containing protein [Massilia glaciei]PWF49337.1 oxidoreductase [Massilia glaciei]
MTDTRPRTIRHPQLEPDIPPAPIPPVQPGLEDCCRGGCTPCVFELYDEALTRYETALARWKSRHAARG